MTISSEDTGYDMVIPTNHRPGQTAEVTRNNSHPARETMSGEESQSPSGNTKSKTYPQAWIDFKDHESRIQRYRIGIPKWNELCHRGEKAVRAEGDDTTQRFRNRNRMPSTQHKL